jgi:hypothetical protein
VSLTSPPLPSLPVTRRSARSTRHGPMSTVGLPAPPGAAARRVTARMRASSSSIPNGLVT